MKKIFIIVLAISITVAFAACSEKPSQTKKEDIKTVKETPLNANKIEKKSTSGKVTIVANDVLQKIRGKWISEEFINYIKVNKSISGAPKQFDFIISEDKTVWSFNELIGQNSQGGNPYTAKVSATRDEKKCEIKLTPIKSDYPYQGKYEDRMIQIENLDSIDRISFIFKDEKYLLIRYDEKEHSADALTKFLLAGKYKDKDGKEYIFGDDMIAIWPNNKFKYSITLAGAERAIDNTFFEFKEGNEYYYYFFKWVNNELQIFKKRNYSNEEPSLEVTLKKV